MPRQLKNLGDRLVYSNGIVLLGVVSGTLLALFHGETHGLLPLYAVTVFLGFTLSQSGMVIHVWKKERRITAPMLLNATGALVTGSVTLVSAVTRFTEGAWMVVVLIPLLIVGMRKVHSHYEEHRRTLTSGGTEIPTEFKHRIVLAASGINQTVGQALRYCKSLNPDHLEAIHIAFSTEEGKRFKEAWRNFEPDVLVTVLTSPYRGSTCCTTSPPCF